MPSDIETKLNQLALRALDRTRSTRIFWHKAGPNAFTYSTPKASMRISQAPQTGSQDLRHEYEFSVFDAEGTPLEQLHHLVAPDDTGEGLALLRDLYFAARENALHPSDVIDELMHDLDQYKSG
jgi:hypothetical protein